MQIYLQLFTRIFVNKNAKAKIKLKSHYVLCLLLNLVINKLNTTQLVDYTYFDERMQRLALQYLLLLCL